ncbi:MAG TPA: hypothetical protein VF743_04085, partial [Acidimicrobiales bacterium]
MLQIQPTRVEAEVSGTTHTAAVGSGPHRALPLGPLEVALSESTWPTYAWSVANRGDAAVAVRSVTLVFTVEAGAPPLRMLRHGYQSWSPTGVATWGTDVDPTTRADVALLRAAHHADQRRVSRPGELRSEWVTLLADGSGGLLLAGFEAGTAHDGTFRLSPAGDGSGGTAAD